MKKKHLISFSFVTVAALILAGAGSAARPSLAAPLATTWFVDAAAGNDGNDCLTAVSACQHVNEAINRAIAADIIQIAAGIYSESIDISVPLALSAARRQSLGFVRF